MEHAAAAERRHAAHVISAARLASGVHIRIFLHLPAAKLDMNNLMQRLYENSSRMQNFSHTRDVISD